MISDFLRPHFMLPDHEVDVMRASLMRVASEHGQHLYRTALPVERLNLSPAGIREPSWRAQFADQHRRTVRRRALAWLLRARGIEP